MFLHLSVSHSVHRGAYVAGGACMAGGRACVCGWKACMSRGVHGQGPVWQERQPLQRTVRMLLECILVFFVFYYLIPEDGQGGDVIYKLRGDLCAQWGI